MNTTGSRGLITLCAGAAVVTGIAWLAAVRPLHAALTDARAELAVRHRQLAEFEKARESGEVAEHQNVSLRRRAAWIGQETSLAQSEDALFDEIERIAAANSVRIIEMAPRRVVIGGSRLKSKESRRELNELHCTLSTEGAYDDLVRLVREIESQTGLCKLASVRLYADRAEAQTAVISATIETVHYALVEPLEIGEGGAP
ncbi:MAG: hypothetical protein H6811_10805 [Phycisphaeraceae bacterium]|nr:hypothetical protein [Phycisphaeraceae bacterium]